MNKASKVVSISIATALGVVLFSGTDAVSADTVPNNTPSQYVIKAGDTLNAIAEDHATTAQAIAEGNSIKDINVIFAGNTITIKGQAPENATATPVAPTQAPVAPVAPTQAPVSPLAPVSPSAPVQAPKAPSTGSAHDQFISAGGTEAMWQSIVMPESGGNVNASNGQYHGLGQTNQSWGHGSVETQTQGMLNYANSRYGSIGNAIAFRQANNWW